MGEATGSPGGGVCPYSRAVLKQNRVGDGRKYLKEDWQIVVVCSCCDIWIPEGVVIMHLAAMFEFLDVIPMPALVSEMTGSDNSSNRPRFLNLAFLERIGYTLDEIPDIERWFEIPYPDPVFRDGARNEWYQAINKSVAEGRRTAEASALIQCKDGRQRWFLVTAQVRSESMPNMHVVTFRDIHDLKVASDRNHYLSQTDQLTQVSSRHAGQQRLESEFFRFSRGGAPFAVVMCDVDHF